MAVTLIKDIVNDGASRNVPYVRQCTFKTATGAPGALEDV